MKYKILKLFLFLFLISCNSNRDDIAISTSSIELSISSFTTTSVNLNYNLNNTSGEKYLIYSKFENLDLQNFEKKILITNLNNIEINNLVPNTKYYFKISYTENNSVKYSNIVSAITKEVSFSVLLNKNIGLTPESGSFIYLMDSELDISKTNIYLLTKQIQHNTTEVKKITLHKIDLNGNVLWSKLIQDSNSPYTYKIQLMSDGNIAVLTGKYDQKTTIITKVNPSNGSIFWQKEYPLIDSDGFSSTIVLGYTYQNSIFKIITSGPNNKEELFVKNDGTILSQKNLITDNNITNQITYLDDNYIISVSGGDKNPYDGSVTSDGMIRKMNISNGFVNAIWTKYYGDFGGNDTFTNYLISDNNIFIQGYYGGTSGFTDPQKWVLRTDMNGEILWQNKQPSRADFIYEGRDIKINENKELLCLMHEMYFPYSNVYDYTSLTKYDSNGNLIWIWKSAPDFNTERFYSNKVFETNNNEFIITGAKSSDVGSIWIKKIKVN